MLGVGGTLKSKSIKHPGAGVGREQVTVYKPSAHLASLGGSHMTQGPETCLLKEGRLWGDHTMPRPSATGHLLLGTREGKASSTQASSTSQSPRARAWHSPGLAVLEQKPPSLCIRGSDSSSQCPHRIWGDVPQKAVSLGGRLLPLFVHPGPLGAREGHQALEDSFPI